MRFFKQNVNVTKPVAMALGAVLAGWLSASTPAMANPQDENFVDSVYDWGSWDLGLEPAAGGSVVPANRLPNIRQRKLQFRPNDNSAFRGNSTNIVTTDTNPAPVPVPLSPPTGGPRAPGQPAPVGNPADRF